MIKNDKQLQSSIRTAKQLEDSVYVYEEKYKINDDLLTLLEMNSVKSQVEKIKAEIQEYNSLKTGTINTVSFSSLLNIPELIVKARIAKQWSHSTLAEKVGLQEQQIQRYEATDYRGASVYKLQRIIDALGIEIPPVTIQVSKPKFDIDDIPLEVIQSGQLKLKESKSFC